MSTFSKKNHILAPRVLRRKNIGRLRADLLNGGQLTELTSQHSLAIEDGTGLEVRLDMNDALQAQAGNQLGDTEPPVTYAGQWWANPGTATLWRRNSTNTAWINVAPLDSTPVHTVNGAAPDANGNIAISIPNSADDIGALPITGGTATGSIIAPNVIAEGNAPGDLSASVTVSNKSWSEGATVQFVSQFNGIGVATNQTTLNADSSAFILFTVALAGPGSSDTRAGALMINGGDKTVGTRADFTLLDNGSRVYSANNPPPETGVQDICLGALQSGGGGGDNASFTAPDGCAVVGYTMDDDDLVSSRWKPIQKLVNGVWATITG
jgi:hypothetical protein